MIEKKITIYRDERGPNYGFKTVEDDSDSFGEPIVKVSEETWQRWNQIEKDYGQMQRELAVLRGDEE